MHRTRGRLINTVSNVPLSQCSFSRQQKLVIGINRPSYFSYCKNFSARSCAVPEILIDEKALHSAHNHPFSQPFAKLAQFDTDSAVEYGSNHHPSNRNTKHGKKNESDTNVHYSQTTGLEPSPTKEIMSKCPAGA